MKTWGDIPNWSKPAEPKQSQRNHTHRNYWDDDEYLDETNLSEAADAYLDGMADEDPVAKCYCGHCGSNFLPVVQPSGEYRCECSSCGTCGPRSDTRDRAVELALDLFPD